LLKLTYTAFKGSLQHGEVIVAKFECDGVEQFLRFFENDSHESAPNFLQSLGENNLL